MSTHRSTATVIASATLSAVLGTIHAFSVFIPQWEGLPGADRASVSLIYSVALVSLTIAVLFGYRIYQRLSPVAMFLLAGTLAALGLWLSAVGSSLIALYVTYGVVFGGANGLGYGYALQLSGQAVPKRRGFVMGLVTAFYAVGATVAPLLFVFLINLGGNAMALKAMSVIVLVVAIIAAFLVRWSGASYTSESSATSNILSPTLTQARVYIWIGYGSAVTAGLMVIGHAYGIAIWMNIDTRFVAWATMIVAFGNMLGGFSAGYYADRISSRFVIFWLPLLTIVGLIVLVLPTDLAAAFVFVALGLIGYCYGAIIAVYPVAVVDVFGSAAAPRIYGQVFTAWGLAGLLGPWAGGWLFDRTGSYIAAIMIAMVFSVISMLSIRLSMQGANVWVRHD